MMVDPAGAGVRLAGLAQCRMAADLDHDAMYLIYEFMHFCCHVDDNWFVRHAPFVNTSGVITPPITTSRRFMMERSNIEPTCPIMTGCFGTSDLESAG